MFLALVGLPRSGTTILCNALNSFENTFFLSELLWNLHRHPDRLTLGKLQRDFHGFRIENAEFVGVVKKCQGILLESSFQLGGLKETYRFPDPTGFFDLIQAKESLIDEVIFLVRNPICNFSAWRRSGFGERYQSIDFFISDYQGLLRLIAEQVQERSVTIMKYELLSEMYFRSSLSHLFSFECLNLKPTGYFFGDGAANRSTSFRPPNLRTDNLTSAEIKALEPYVHLYSDLPDGSVDVGRFPKEVLSAIKQLH